MSKIRKLEIDTTVMPTVETSRTVKVTGKVGAKFFVILTQAGTIKFYDWTTDTFTDGHAPKNNLTVTMSSNFFQRNIVFPTGSGTGGTYVLKLITLDETKTTGGFSVISKNIEKQTSDTTITFKPASNVSSTKYATLPSFTAVGTDNAVVINDYSFTVTTASTDAGGFGLRSIFGGDNLEEIKFVLQLIDYVRNLFYYQTTKTISENLNGDGEMSNEIVLSDVTDLSAGTQVYYHKGTTAPTGTVKIEAVDSNSKTVIFDNPVAFENSETITFRAYGVEHIYNAINLLLDINEIEIVNADEVSKIMRNDSSSTTLELNNTLGIPGGNIVSILGVDVDNSSANTVTSVTPDPTGGDGDGSVVVQVSQNLSQGTVITFPNTFTSITFAGSIVVSQFPDSNKEINLDLDQLLITGSAS